MSSLVPHPGIAAHVHTDGDILLVEDDAECARVLRAALAISFPQLRVQHAATARQAIAWLGGVAWAFAVVDLGLPDADGLDVIRAAMRIAPAPVPTLVLTGERGWQRAVQAMKAGARDYLVKDENMAARVSAVARDLVSQPPRGALEADESLGLIGESLALERLRGQIRCFARSAEPVLIEGETGVGKELVARALHSAGARASEPMVAVNSGALPEQLFESELFGHVRGAFTGADRDRVGLIDSANGGSLFLDEIEDLPLVVQGKLLRFLQEGEYRPVGANRSRRAKVRILAASNAALQDLVDQRRIRADLYFRLNVLRIEVPPLRQRLEDLEPLIRHFFRQAEPTVPEDCCWPSAQQLEEMRAYGWPGNVRELRNCAVRARVLGRWAMPWIGEGEVSHGPGGCGASSWRPLEGNRADSLLDRCGENGLGRRGASWDSKDARAALLQELQRHRWRRDLVAQALGISRVTLWRRMRRLGIDA